MPVERVMQLPHLLLLEAPLRLSPAPLLGVQHASVGRRLRLCGGSLPRELRDALVQELALHVLVANQILIVLQRGVQDLCTLLLLNELSRKSVDLLTMIFLELPVLLLQLR